MMHEMFNISGGCETPSACPIIKQCQRAVVIDIEARYVQSGLADSVQDLENVIKLATCDHEQVEEAVNFARSVAREKGLTLNISSGDDEIDSLK